MSVIGDGRKSILDAVNRLVSTAAKDGKGPLAKQLYSLQQEKNYEQFLLKGLAPIIEAIEAMALTMDETKRIGREVKAVAHGNVISLVNRSDGSYLSMQEDCCLKNSSVRSVVNSRCELFLVVGAGDGRVAFFNPSENRFLAVVGKQVLPSAAVTNFHDIPRGGETFEMNDKNGSVSLFCPAEGVYVSYNHGRGSLECTTKESVYSLWKVIQFDI